MSKVVDVWYDLVFHHFLDARSQHVLRTQSNTMPKTTLPLNTAAPPKNKDPKLKKTPILPLNANVSLKQNVRETIALSPLSILMVEMMSMLSLLMQSMSTQLSSLFSTPMKTSLPSLMLSDVKKKLKFSPEAKIGLKKPAFLISFCNRDQVRIQCMKYLKHSVNLLINQERQLMFLLNKFQAREIKAFFYKLIGKVGGLATSVFLPMSVRKTKLIDEFLCLIYDHKSMMINTDKPSYC